MERVPADGHMPCVRPLAPKDEKKLRAMFERLSEKSIYHRFHIPYPRVPEWMASRLSDVHPRDTRSFIAVVRDEVVGHAMFVMENAREAEFAVVVEDEWQSRGVGKLLLFRLALEAELRGVETFTATVLGENWRVIGLLEAAFSKVEYRIKGGAFHVRIPFSVPRSASKPEESRRIKRLAS